MARGFLKQRYRDSYYGLPNMHGGAKRRGQAELSGRPSGGSVAGRSSGGRAGRRCCRWRWDGRQWAAGGGLGEEEARNAAGGGQAGQPTAQGGDGQAAGRPGSWVPGGAAGPGWVAAAKPGAAWPAGAGDRELHGRRGLETKPSRARETIVVAREGQRGRRRGPQGPD
ncbi:uncharacterized protein LOC131856807 [Cryptomeria japonica]|uniref:uncharacterized protein LOC131856807 n=1 Tax=Cryptomeria japonica TaxID=3369 RepID=UPI0027D9EBF9|nr:uncharacterized protein LOC131856807 [Cryptomeria japonica]